MHPKGVEDRWEPTLVAAVAVEVQHDIVGMHKGRMHELFWLKRARCLGEPLLHLIYLYNIEPLVYIIL